METRLTRGHSIPVLTGIVAAPEVARSIKINLLPSILKMRHVLVWHVHEIVEPEVIFFAPVGRLKVLSSTW
jgi:hypothetical protein